MAIYLLQVDNVTAVADTSVQDNVDLIHELAPGDPDDPVPSSARGITMYGWIMPRPGHKTVKLNDGYRIKHKRKRNTSLSEGNSEPKVELEFVLDLVCPDSARSWEVMKALIPKFSSDDLRIVLEVYPLPFHRNSFILSQVWLYKNGCYHYYDWSYKHNIKDPPIHWLNTYL